MQFNQQMFRYSSALGNEAATHNLKLYKQKSDEIHYVTITLEIFDADY